MSRSFIVSVSLLAITACSPPQPEGPMSDAPGASATEAATSSGGDPLAAYGPTEAQREGVVEGLQRLFDALATGDEALLRSAMDPSVVMHWAETRDGETTFGSSTLDGLASRITSSEVTLTERMWDPVVVVNGELATIWAPYDFYAGDTFSHCGVDTANLLHTDDGWKIVGLAWTRLQPPACDLHPDGPPSGVGP